MNNLIINFLITLKNAVSLKKELTQIPYNKHFKPFLLFFYDEGLIQSFKINLLSNQITIIFNSSSNNYFTKLKLISKPSQNIYLSHKEITLLSTKQKNFCFSTDKGFQTLKGCKQLKLGGKLYFTL